MFPRYAKLAKAIKDVPDVDQSIAYGYGVFAARMSVELWKEVMESILEVQHLFA